MSKIVKLNLWELAGNEDTNSTEDYIGTTDGEPLTIQLLGDDTKIEGRTYIGEGGLVDYLVNKGTLDISQTITFPGGTSFNATAGIRCFNTLENTSGMTAAFGSGLKGSSFVQIFRPSSSIGAGADYSVCDALQGIGTWNPNGTTRTFTGVVRGVLGQAYLNGGSSAANMIGLAGQAGVVVSGTVTSAISVQALAPFELFGGSVITGISLQTIGGTQAGANWNISAEGASTPNRFQGNSSLGHTGVPSFAADCNNLRVRGSNNLALGGTGAGDQSLNIQAVFGSLFFTFQNGSFNEGLFISGNAANNEIQFGSITDAKFRIIKNSFFDEGNQTQDELSTTGVKIMSGYTQTHPNFSLDTEVEIEGELLVI